MDFFLSFSLTIVSPISRQFFWQLKKRDLDLWIRIYSKRTLAVSRHLGENAQLAFQNFNITDLKWRLHKLGSHILFCAILGPRLQIFHSSFITWQPRQKIMRTRKIQFELVKLLTHKETCSNFRRFRFLRRDFLSRFTGFVSSHLINSVGHVEIFSWHMLSQKMTNLSFPGSSFYRKQIWKYPFSASCEIRETC